MNRYLISTAGEYSLYYIKDEEFNAFYLNVCKGDWQSQNPSTIAFVAINGIEAGKTPEETVRMRVNDLNNLLREKMAPTDPTWQQRMEAELNKLHLFLSGNIPQVS